MSASNVPAGHSVSSAVIPGLVWAFRIHADGRSEPLDVDQPVDIRGDGLLWLHFNLADIRAAQWIATSALDLPGPAKALFLSKDNFQQMHAADDTVYGVISDLLRAIDRVTEETGYLRFVMTERLLVSGRHQALCAVDATRRMLESGQRIGSAAELFETIVEYVAETMERIADRVEQDLDAIEERVLSDDVTDMRKDLGRLRRTCVRLHRQLSGLRFTFHRLEQQGDDVLKPTLRLLQEELQLKIEEQSNKSLHLLSVLTSLLLPPTLITGIFGMNTKGLPLTDVDSGFFWAGALIIGSSAAAYYTMKRLGIMR